MKKTIVYLIVLVFFIPIVAEGKTSTDTASSDSVELNLCYIKNDSLRSMLNHFFKRTDGSYEQYYEVQICEFKDSLIMMFAHLRDGNRIVDKIPNNNTRTEFYGCMIYNNLTFFIYKERTSDLSNYFEMLENKILLKRSERVDRRSEGIFFIYLENEYYLFDGWRVRQSNGKEYTQSLINWLNLKNNHVGSDYISNE